MTQLRKLVVNGMKQITQTARLEDARRCREVPIPPCLNNICRQVMRAYRNLALTGQVASAESLKLWEKKHRRHRGVHSSEITALLQEVGMVVPARDIRVVQKLNTQAKNNELKSVMRQRNEKRWMHIKRRNANLNTYNDDDTAKQKAKLRKQKWLDNKRTADPEFRVSKRIKLN
jgi:hypothetical protein